MSYYQLCFFGYFVYVLSNLMYKVIWSFRRWQQRRERRLVREKTCSESKVEEIACRTAAKRDSEHSFALFFRFAQS